jgi:hypothetical protein
MEELDNMVRGYNVVLGALKASSDDICVNCINLEAGKTKVGKGLKKLKMDVEKSTIPDEKKKELSSRIEALSGIAEGIPLASECSCQKSAGICKLEVDCFVTAAFDLLKIASP